MTDTLMTDTPQAAPTLEIPRPRPLTRPSVHYEQIDRYVCRRCGVRRDGPHKTAEQCIEALRDVIIESEREMSERKSGPISAGMKRFCEEKKAGRP